MKYLCEITVCVGFTVLILCSLISPKVPNGIRNPDNGGNDNDNDTKIPDWIYNNNTESWEYTNISIRHDPEICLMNKHIIMLGDCRTRYQYLNLATRIAQGSWPKCTEDRPIKEEFCISSDELKRTNWIDFFIRTNELLKGNGSGGSSERCDCYRPEDSEMTWQQAIPLISENRYFTKNKIKLTYLQHYGHSEWAEVDLKDSSDIDCSPGKCSNESLIVRYNITEYLEKVVMKLEPTHIFLGDGWQDRDMSCLAKKYTNVKMFTINNPLGTSVSVDVVQKCSVDRLDRREMTRSLPADIIKYMYWDSMHTLTSLNKEFNYKMMSMIC